MDTTIVVILAVICFLLGIILDNLIHTLTGQPEGAKQKEKSSEAAPASLQPPIAGELAKPRTGLGEAARLWRDLQDHRLAVELDGQVYRQNSALTPQQINTLTSILKELSTWLGPGGQAIITPAPAVPATPASPAPPADQQAVNAVQAEHIVPAAGTPSPSTASDQDLPIIFPSEIAPLENPVKPISLNPFSSLVKSLQSDIRSPEGPTTMAGQVNAILQEKLKTSPLASRGIRIVETQGHTIEVWVGMEKFDGVDAVTDPEVRQFIQNAVNEWVKRMPRA